MQTWIDFFLTFEDNGNKMHGITSGLKPHEHFFGKIHTFPSGTASRDFTLTPQKDSYPTRDILQVFMSASSRTGDEPFVCDSNPFLTL